MSQFEDNLWGSVVDRHGDDLARTDALVATRARRTGPRLLAGATVAVAASATAVTLLVSAAASPPPAFAVTRHHDGSVLVKINRRSGIAGANRTLAAMGIHERVAVSDGQSKGEYCVSRLSSQQLSYLDSHSTAITLPGGRTVVLTPKAGQHTVFKAGGTTGSGNTGSGNTGPGNTSSSTVHVVTVSAPFHVSACPAGLPGNTGSGNTGNTGNPGAG